MLNIARHELIFNNIIKDIYSDRFLAPILGFKGGTACYLFYGLPRFSTDLDFDLLDIKQDKEVLKRVEKILSKYGTVKESAIKRYTVFLLLSYEEKAQNVKVEISIRDFQDKYKIRNYFGVPVLVIAREDMFANKLLALSQRKEMANRDLFDVHFFLERNWDINEEIIKARANKNLKQYLKYLITFVEKNVSDRHILAGLGEVLDEKQKQWVKTNLKKELIFLLNVYIKDY